MKSLRWTALLWLLGASPALADELAPIGGAGQIARTALGLVLIIGLVLALGWAARRLSGRGFGTGRDGGAINVVGQQALGVKERLLLVEVEGRRILLGVSPGRIARLADLGTASGRFDEQLDAERSKGGRG
jgi:flagellar protein FliO/FliZ